MLDKGIDFMKGRRAHVTEFIIISMISSSLIVSQVGASETPKMAWLKNIWRNRTRYC